MRKDEEGNDCPATLGEYRDVVMAFVSNEHNPAVRFLDQRIAGAPHGRDEKVLAPDSQMRHLLMPLMVASDS